jgi:succinate dehydrogenase / fumarate reductase membrane anchor subunit
VVNRRFTGLTAWLVQRAGAVYMLLFAVFMLVSLRTHPKHSYVEWKAWVTSASTSVAIAGFVLALLTHMWVGLRDVILDYAKPERFRRSLLCALALALVGMAAWMAQMLLRARL